MKKTFLQLVLFLLLSFFLVGEASALTPIARVDVVPYQTIEYGTSFKFGVVAFHKKGIEKIEFYISGQGYTGGTKTATQITYNDRTDVWEYWVPISSSEFNTDGSISVESIVYGNDGDVRELPAIVLIVEATRPKKHTEVWVDTINNDGEGTVGDASDPFPVLYEAIDAAQIANGGTSDGVVVYLSEGTHTLGGYYSGGGNVNASKDYLTITRAKNTSREKVVLNEGGAREAIDLVHIKEITLRRDDVGLFGKSGLVWIDGSNITSSAGRWVANTNPLNHSNAYYTNGTYIYNVDRGIRGEAKLVRGVKIEFIGEDAFQNAPFVVNVKIDDKDPGSTGWHADTYQIWANPGGSGVENRIVYGLYATDQHIQGLFLRGATDPPAKNNAFVNVFIEMREDDYKTKTASAWYGNWEHLLVWNCSWPTYGDSGFLKDGEYGFSFKNVSFVGNVFYHLVDYITSWEPVNSPFFDPGNPYDNEALYNHYVWSCLDQGSCSWDNLPSPNSKSPDSAPEGSHSYGDAGLIMDDFDSSFFGFPTTQSVLVDKINDPKVPVDALGNPRGKISDIGALEHQDVARIIRADVDNSQQINTTDALLTLRKSLNLDINKTSWQETSTTGDTNCDEEVNSTDALLILRYSLGLDMIGTGWCG